MGFHAVLEEYCSIKGNLQLYNTALLAVKYNTISFCCFYQEDKDSCVPMGFLPKMHMLLWIAVLAESLSFS